MKLNDKRLDPAPRRRGTVIAMTIDARLCHQAARVVFPPLLAVGRAFCRRCCPACIRIALRMTRAS
jgi:hypothetical protein